VSALRLGRILRRAALPLSVLCVAACAGSPPPQSEATAPSTPRAAPAPETDRPGLPAGAETARGPTEWVPVPMAALADALGNGDGELSGVELELLAALEALPADARCWLSVTRRGGGGEGYRNGRVRLWRVIADATGLDCGPAHQGLPAGAAPPLPSERGATLALRVAAPSAWLDPMATIGGGRRSNLHLLGPLRSPGPPLPLAEIGRRILEQAGADPVCERRLRGALRRRQADLEAGRCPLEELLGHSALDDYHAPQDAAAPCAGQPLLEPTLDLAAVQRCPLTPDAPYLPDLLAAFRGRARSATRSTGFLEVLCEELASEPLDSLGVRCPGAWDATRALAAAEALQRAGRLDAEGRRALLQSYDTLPLGLRASQANALGIGAR